MDPINITSDSVPILGIKGFQKTHFSGNTEILFNELHGERYIEKPHKHDFFIIILFEKANGVHNIDSIDFQIGNKEVHVLFPGQMHKWDIRSGTIGYQLMIEKPFLEQFAPAFRFSFTNYQNHPVIRLNDDSFKKLLYEFNAIKEELTIKNSLKQLISARAAVIAAIVSKQAEKEIDEFKIYQSHPRLAKFNQLIDEFYKEQKSIAFYADQLNITPNYLNILCKRNLYVHALKLVNQRVVIEAKRLLQDPSISIKIVAFTLGFADHAYFTNFFKNQTGLTPSQFRAQL